MGGLAGSSVTASLCLLRATGAGAAKGGGGGGIRILTREKHKYLQHKTIRTTKMFSEHTFLLLSPPQCWKQDVQTPDERDPLESCW